MRTYYLTLCALAVAFVAMAEAPKHNAERHTLIVDEIEEGSARVEVDGENITNVPASLLPAGAKEGDVITVTFHIEAR